MSMVRKGDKRITAPPDFMQPELRMDLPNIIDKIRKQKENTKGLRVYDFKTILQAREDFESYVKPLAIVKIWRRKMRTVILYSFQKIINVGDQDESWILPYDIVKVQRRKMTTEICVDEYDQE